MLCNIDSLFVNSKSNIEPQEILSTTDPESDKVHITLKQIVRDWADEGAKERSQCYEPILNELSKHFDINNMTKNQYKIVSNQIAESVNVFRMTFGCSQLVPGAGLARLVYEISLRGFYCEGNEFSLFMLIASNFLLNRCLIDNQYEIYPYVHQFVNNMSREDALVSSRFPDVSPCELNDSSILH